MYESQVPIDINCSKLVDWLVQRRHCNREWGENLSGIRRKIRSALKDMPENEQIKQLLTNAKIDYFKCKKIVDILKQTEADTKNFFGYYSSQRMKDWQDIVCQYEKNCIYLAEIGTNLIREVNYEVPGVKRLITKFIKDKEEAEKERTNALKKEQQILAEYNRLAVTYGIKGEDITSELKEELASLQPIIKEIVNVSQKLSQPLQYYRQFAESTSWQETCDLVKTLNHVITKGNTTVFVLKYGEPPEIIKESPQQSATTASQYEIDFGDEEIDFGDVPSSESSSGFVHVDKSNDNGNGSQSTGEDYIKIENEKVARNDEAKKVLEYRKTRNEFMNDLLELEAFYTQLSLSELSEKDNSIHIERFNEEEIKTILTDIRQIINILNKERNKILFQINDSPVFIEEIKDKFDKILKQAINCRSKAEQMVEQIIDIEKQIRETEEHLKQSINNAKQSQEKVESSLRKLYNGRPINIMGCVYYK